MWASNPISFGSYLPSARCPSAQPRRSHRSTSTTSSSPQLQPSQDVGGLGHAVLNALHSSSSPVHQSTSKTLAATNTGLSKGNGNQSEQGQQPREERELTGSEVLMALQKAGVRRSRSVKGGKKKERPLIGGGGQTAVDYTCIRPLNIKSDWSVRLKELETRLQEILNV